MDRCQTVHYPWFWHLFVIVKEKRKKKGCTLLSHTVVILRKISTSALCTKRMMQENNTKKVLIQNSTKQAGETQLFVNEIGPRTETNFKNLKAVFCCLCRSVIWRLCKQHLFLSTLWKGIGYNMHDMTKHALSFFEYFTFPHNIAQIAFFTFIHLVERLQKAKFSQDKNTASVQTEGKNLEKKMHFQIYLD